MDKNLAIFGDKIVLLSKQLRSSAQSMSNIPYLIKQILDDEMWKLFQHPSASQVIDNSNLSFVEFVTTQPPVGLGSELKDLENILVVQTRSNNNKDAEIAQEGLQILSREVGKAIEEMGLHTLPESIANRFENEKKSSSKAKISALRRLERERPDLYSHCMEGKISINQAMIEAGFRKRRFSVPQDNISGAANAIRNRLTEEQILALITELRQRN